MRGPLRWAENRGTVCNAAARSKTLRIAERPPHPPRFARTTSPRTRGEVNKQSRSRGAISGRGFVRSVTAPSSIPAFASLTRATANKMRKWNAERRKVLIRATHADVTVRRRFGRGAAQRRGRSPLGVPSRFSPDGCHLLAQLQARLPGTRREHTTLWTALRRRSGASPRALSAPAYPSPVSTSHTGRSTGEHDARSRPGAGYKPARRRRTRPCVQVCLPDKSSWARFDSETIVSKQETIVKQILKFALTIAAHRDR